MERNFEINEAGYNIRCKIYCSDMKNIKKVVLFGHGFAGHKDNRAAFKFADRVMTKYKGIAVITYNAPCHGDDVRKKLKLEDCLTYIDLVLAYIKKEYTEEIYSYATSFGGYCVLRYIADRGNPFKKIALRSPAIPMYELLTEGMIKPEEMDRLHKGKDVAVGFDRKITVNMDFLEELKNADVRDIEFFDYADDILILHGSKDEVVDYDTVYRFAEDNCIEFIRVEGADHRFQKPACMEAAIKSILAFFSF